MYSVTNSQWLTISSSEPNYSQKDSLVAQIEDTTNMYQSSRNDPIQNNNYDRGVEFMDSSVESLLKEQIFLMKFILLFLGLLLSNILAKELNFTISKNTAFVFTGLTT